MLWLLRMATVRHVSSRVSSPVRLSLRSELLNYIGQQVASNSRDIANSMTALSNQINNQTAAIQARFDALNQQKIADQAA